MVNMEEVYNALRKANAQGNTVAVAKLAEYIKTVEASQPGLDAQTAGEYARAIPKGVGMVAGAIPKALGLAAGLGTQGLERVFEGKARTPITDNPLYKVGQGIEDVIGGDAYLGDVRQATKDQLGYKVVEGAGQLAGFGAPALINRGVGTVAPYVLGSALGGVGQVEEYNQDREAKGLPIEGGEQLRQLVAGLAIGVTEGMPIERALKKFGVPSDSRTLNMIKQAAQEGGQEIVAQLLGNSIAKGTYAPEREVSKGAGEAGTVGGILGGAMGALIPGRAKIETTPTNQGTKREDLSRKFGLSVDPNAPEPSTERERLIKAAKDRMITMGLDPKQAKKDPLVRRYLNGAEAYELNETGEAEIKALEEQTKGATGAVANVNRAEILKIKQKLIKAKKTIAELESKEDITPGDGTLPDVSEGDIDTLSIEDPITSEFDGVSGKTGKRKSEMEISDVDQILRENPSLTVDESPSQRFVDRTGDLPPPPPTRVNAQGNLEIIPQETPINSEVAAIPGVDGPEVAGSSLKDPNYQPDPLKGKGLLTAVRDSPAGPVEASGEGVQGIVERKAGILRPKVENSKESMQAALNEPSQRVSGENQLEETTDAGQYWETEADARQYEEDLNNYTKIVKEWRKTKDPKRKAELDAKINRIVDTETRIHEAQHTAEKDREAAIPGVRAAFRTEQNLDRKEAQSRILNEQLDKDEKKLGAITGGLDAGDARQAQDTAKIEKIPLLKQKLANTTSERTKKSLTKQIKEIQTLKNQIAKAKRDNAVGKEFGPLGKTEGDSSLPLENEGEPSVSPRNNGSLAVRARDTTLESYVARGDLEQVLDHLATYPKYTIIVNRLRRVLAVQGKAKIELWDPDNITPEQQWYKTEMDKGHAGVHFRDSYFGLGGKTFIRKGNVNAHTVLHELVHHAISGRLAIGLTEAHKNTEVGKAARQLQSTLEAIREHLRKELEGAGESDVMELFGTNSALANSITHFRKAQKASDLSHESIYGLTNEQELIAEALSNPDFQRWLMTIKPARQGQGIRNMLSNFMLDVAELLGFKKNTALYDIMEAFDVLSSQSQVEMHKLKSTLTERDRLQGISQKGTFNPLIDPSNTPEEAFGEVSMGKRVLQKLNVVEGGADTLQNRNSPILHRLGNAVREYVSKKAEFAGKFEDKFYKAVDAYKDTPRAKREQFRTEYSSFFSALTYGRMKEAKGILENAMPEVVNAIEATREALELAGDLTVKGGVLINREGKIIPFTKIKNYFPLVVQRDWRAVLNDPNDPSNLDKTNKLVNWMIDNGKAKTRDEALELINGYSASTRKMDDFYGNLERSRSDSMPEWIYDFTPDAVAQYRDGWSQRLAQIESFGQKIGDKKTKFQEAHDHPEIQGYNKDLVKKMAEAVYGETLAGDTIINGRVGQFFDFLNNIAVINQLVGVGATLNNYVLGWSLQASSGGVVKTARAYEELMENMPAVREAARKKGIIKSNDIINLSADNRLNAPGKSKWLDIAKYFTNQGAQAGLKYGGFNEAENQVRMGSYLVAKYNLEENLVDIANNDNTADSEIFVERMNREGVDVSKLLEERGKEEQPETDKYYRKMVNLVHGSYDVDQVPPELNGPIGRFFFKYYKFATQALRQFLRDRLVPMLNPKNGLSKNARAKLGLETVKYLMVAALAGLGFMELKDELFGTETDGSKLDVMVKNLQDDKYGEAVGNLASSLLAGLIYGGNLGLVSQIYKGAEVINAKYEGTYTPTKFKNPIEAPGTALLSNIANFSMQWLTEDKYVPDLDDINQFAKETNRFYRELHRLYGQTASGVAPESLAGRKQQADEDIKYTKGLMREYLAEKEIKFPDSNEDSGIKDLVSLINIKRPDKRRDIKWKVREALMIGESGTAHQLVTDYMKANSPDRSTFKSNEDSIKKGVEAFDPLYINLPDDEKAKIQNEFITWAKESLPKSEYARVVDATKRYRTAAMKADLWEPISKKAQTKREKPFFLDREIKKRFKYDD